MRSILVLALLGSITGVPLPEAPQGPQNGDVNGDLYPYYPYYHGYPYHGYYGYPYGYYGYPYYYNYYPYNYGYKSAPVAPAPVAPAPVAPAPVAHAPVAHAPVAHAPVAPVYHGGMVFIGKFTGTCENEADGLFYIDGRSFAYCAGGRKTIQACADGSANPDFSHFKAGERYQHYEFCSINLAAQVNSHF